MEKVFKSLGITKLVWDSPSDVKGMENGKIVTNEFIFELYKLFKDSGKQFSVFYEVISNLVPCDTFEKFAAVKAATFRGSTHCSEEPNKKREVYAGRIIIHAPRERRPGYTKEKAFKGGDQRQS